MVKENGGELDEQHHRIHAEHELVSAAFLTSVKDRFPEAGDDEIAIRKDWQLVAYRPRPSVALGLGALLAMGGMGLVIVRGQPQNDE